MMLLDTHALIWLVAEPKRLSQAAATSRLRDRRAWNRKHYAVGVGDAFLQRSSASNRDNRFCDSVLMVERARVAVRTLLPRSQLLLPNFLPPTRPTLANRLIGATARAERLTLVTRDRRIRESNLVSTVW